MSDELHQDPMARRLQALERIVTTLDARSLAEGRRTRGWKLLAGAALLGTCVLGLAHPGIAKDDEKGGLPAVSARVTTSRSRLSRVGWGSVICPNGRRERLRFEVPLPPILTAFGFSAGPASLNAVHIAPPARYRCPGRRLLSTPTRGYPTNANETREYSA